MSSPSRPPGPPLPSPPTLSPPERVREACSRREATDYRFEHPWLNVLLMLLTCGIFGLYLFYQLVRRSRDHNQRRLDLLEAATAVAWDEANRKGLAEELRPAFERVAGHLEVLRRITREFRDPTIWLVIALFASGIAQLVAFVLLDGDLVKHDGAEVAIEQELAAIYGRLGETLPLPEPGRVKRPDNYVGRVVATIATCGIYTLWWWVDQQRVGDAHYAANRPFEDGLAAAVGHLEASA